MKRYIRSNSMGEVGTKMLNSDYSYMVVSGNNWDEGFETDDPREAIEQWFRNQYPRRSGAILTRTRQEACALLDAATPKFISEMCDNYEPVYSTADSLLNEIRNQRKNGCADFIDDEYGDVVAPFFYS